MIALSLCSTSCSRVGEPPPGWFDEPISRAHYCGASMQAPGPIAKRSSSTIADVLRSSYSDIDACYRELLARNPDAFGSLDVRLLIAPTGAVTDACVVEATLDDEPTSVCILYALERRRFTAVKGYELVRVPLRFQARTPFWLADFPITAPPPSLDEDALNLGPTNIER
jgi:hypothetical protein